LIKFAEQVSQKIEDFAADIFELNTKTCAEREAFK